MLKKFFVLTRGRTGSTAVMDELDKSYGISAGQELFLIWEFDKRNADTKEMFDLIWPFVLWKEEHKTGKFALLFSQDDQYLANQYLSLAESRSKERGSSGFGFKVLRNNLDEWPFLLRLLRKRKYRAIYLDRNTSNRVLSGMIANMSGVWNTKKEMSLGKFDIDIEEFRKKVEWEYRQVELDCSLLSSAGISYLTVKYEKFCSDRRSFFDEIFLFLGVSSQLPPSSEYRIILKNLPGIIRNYEEVSRAAEAIGFPLVN